MTEVRSTPRRVGVEAEELVELGRGDVRTVTRVGVAEQWDRAGAGHDEAQADAAQVVVLLLGVTALADRGARVRRA